MERKEKEYVFLDVTERSGISAKNNKPYEIYQISFADPLTFQNHLLNVKKGLNLTWLQQGDRVHIYQDLQPGFNGRTSQPLVIDVQPVK